MVTMGIVRLRNWRRALMVLGLLALASLAAGAASADARSGEERSAPRERGGPGVGNCVICHGSPEILEVEGAVPTLLVPPAVISASVHSDLSCQDCHGTLEANLPDHPEMLRGRAQDSCGACHGPQARLLERGAHGPSSRRPRAEAAESAVPSGQPSCLTCHGAHETLPSASREFAAAAARDCSGCHSERGESFFDRNYHGKETRLGRHDVAVCSDCHGAHRVLPSSDPRSPVSRANVLGTCRQCHPAAPDNFADIIIHVGGRPLPDDPRLMGATLAMMVILVVTFGLFGAHTVLALRHEFRSRRRRGGE